MTVCPPFVILSATQDPQSLCRAVHRFYDHFPSTYSARRPGAWVTIHHYESSDALKEQALRHGGPECPSLLGYHDYRTQSIAFRAPVGFFGTLQHELTHVLVFWDMPLAPRWFEEGLAALHEHTDNHYRGLPDPWREEILARFDNPARAFGDILALPWIEFEMDPVPATVSRATLMRVQALGGLPELYDEVGALPESQAASGDVADGTMPCSRLGY